MSDLIKQHKILSLLTCTIVLVVCLNVFAALTNTYDTATPAGSDDPRFADDRMREIKAAIQERMNDHNGQSGEGDHYWPLTGTQVSDTDAGQHRMVTLRQLADNPSTLTSYATTTDLGFLYQKDVSGNGELFWEDEADNVVQITDSGSLINPYVPVGCIQMYGGSSAPTGWLLCQGQEVSRTTYADLFAVIGTTFGVGNGSTTFNVPDMLGRVPIGVGTGDASDATAHTLGEKEGTETHTLTEAEMPSHGHPYRTADGGTGDGSGGLMLDLNGTRTNRAATTEALSDSATRQISGTGGDQAHNNLQPSLGLNFIIKT